MLCVCKLEDRIIVSIIILYSEKIRIVKQRANIIFKEKHEKFKSTVFRNRNSKTVKSSLKRKELQVLSTSSIEQIDRF